MTKANLRAALVLAIAIIAVGGAQHAAAAHGVRVRDAASNWSPVRVVQLRVAAPALSPGTTSCNGTYGGSGGFVVVPAGATCTLVADTHVAANVTVRVGGTLNATGVRIDGNLTIVGNATVCQSRIRLDVMSLFPRGSLTFGGPSCPGNTIGNDLVISNENHSLRIWGNKVGNSLIVRNSHGAIDSIVGNKVGNLRVAQSGPVFVKGNHANHGSLRCVNDTPLTGSLKPPWTSTPAPSEHRNRLIGASRTLGRGENPEANRPAAAPGEPELPPLLHRAVRLAARRPDRRDRVAADGRARTGRRSRSDGRAHDRLPRPQSPLLAACRRLGRPAGEATADDARGGHRPRTAHADDPDRVGVRPPDVGAALHRRVPPRHLQRPVHGRVRELLPDDRGRDDYVAANWVVHGTRGASFLLGNSLGGALVQLLSGPYALAADAVSFFWSALFLRRIDAEEPPGVPRESGGVLSGLRWIRDNAIIRRNCSASRRSTSSTSCSSRCSCSTHRTTCTFPRSRSGS